VDSPPGLITILRAALAHLSDESTGPPDDPAIIRFKQRMLRSIAQLELERNSLRAPDVITPEGHSAESGEPSAAPAADLQSVAPDSVIVLVARRPRKSGNDDNGSGHTSAA